MTSAAPDRAVHDHEHGPVHAHDHAHGHAHGHHHVHSLEGPAHGVTNEGRLLAAFVVIAVFMVVEVAGAWISGSLALLADAGHMASDAAALAFSWYATRMGRRAATAEMSYGWRRMEVLAAFVNGLALFAIAVWIVIEAGKRFFEPEQVLGGPMFAVAVAGLVANLVAFWILAHGGGENLNVRSAWLHVLGDLLGSVAAIAAALVILATGWMPIDPLLSIFVSVVILRGAWHVVRSAAHILLEGSPPGVQSAEILADLQQAVPEVASAHHIHVWSITTDAHLVTLHVVPADGVLAETVIAAVQGRLRDRFGVDHVTIQVERGDCADEDSRAVA